MEGIIVDNNGMIHRIGSSYNVISIAIFFLFSVSINCELSMGLFYIIIQIIIEWMRINQLILAVYNSCYTITARTCGITSVCNYYNGILSRAVSIAVGCAIVDIGHVIMIECFSLWVYYYASNIIERKYRCICCL